MDRLTLCLRCAWLRKISSLYPYLWDLAWTDLLGRNIFLHFVCHSLVRHLILDEGGTIFAPRADNSAQGG
jgi:hypothetical protein